MATIRTRCGLCGDDVELHPDEVELVLDTQHRRGSYRFSCPNCDQTIAKPADERTAMMLIEAGVVLRRAEPEHPEDPPAGPAFTFDDLLDLHVLLATDDWFERLIAAGTPALAASGREHDHRT